MSKTREKYPLSYKKITKKTIEKMFPLVWAWFFVFILIPGIFMVVGDGEISRELLSNAREILGAGGLSVIAVGALLAIVIPSLLMYVYQRWYFATYFYDLTEDHVIIRKGPITPQEITIPYERIQDVYVDQDILDRIFDVYDVHLSSATASSGMQAHIDGVDRAAADGLRQILLEAISKRMTKK